MQPPRTPDPEIELDALGLHVNDAPQDDPTRFLLHYDGHPWPWLIAAAFVAAIVGFVGGLWMGTDHYTISTVCNPHREETR